MDTSSQYFRLASLVLAIGLAGLSVPAWAQRPGNDVGTGQSLPLSDNASNTTPDNTHSEIAPRLPAPPVPEGAPPSAFLIAARQAVSTGSSGEAQEALERAETRVLDRSVSYNANNQAIRSPLIEVIMEARGAVAQGDRQRALQLIDSALQMPAANAAGE